MLQATNFSVKNVSNVTQYDQYDIQLNTGNATRSFKLRAIWFVYVPSDENSRLEAMLKLFSPLNLANQTLQVITVPNQNQLRRSG
jgi:hypothetical protein